MEQGGLPVKIEGAHNPAATRVDEDDELELPYVMVESRASLSTVTVDSDGGSMAASTNEEVAESCDGRWHQTSNARRPPRTRTARCAPLRVTRSSRPAPD